MCCTLCCTLYAVLYAVQGTLVWPAVPVVPSRHRHPSTAKTVRRPPPGLASALFLAAAGPEAATRPFYFPPMRQSTQVPSVFGRPVISSWLRSPIRLTHNGHSAPRTRSTLYSVLCIAYSMLSSGMHAAQSNVQNNTRRRHADGTGNGRSVPRVLYDAVQRACARQRQTPNLTSPFSLLASHPCPPVLCAIKQTHRRGRRCV